MKEYPYERYLRDARILLIFEVFLSYHSYDAKLITVMLIFPCFLRPAVGVLD